MAPGLHSRVGFHSHLDTLPSPEHHAVFASCIFRLTFPNQPRWRPRSGGTRQPLANAHSSFSRGRVIGVVELCWRDMIPWIKCMSKLSNHCLLILTLRCAVFISMYIQYSPYFSQTLTLSSNLFTKHSNKLPSYHILPTCSSAWPCSRIVSDLRPV